MTSEIPEPRDVGDLLAVPVEQRQDVDPEPGDDPTHTAADAGEAEDVSDEPEGDYVDPADLQED